MLDWIRILSLFGRESWRISEYMRIYWMLVLQQGVVGLAGCGVYCLRSGKKAVGFEAWSSPEVFRVAEFVI